MIHDRDSIFSKQLDQRVTNLGVRVLRTPIRAPRANAVCERLGGSRIPLSECHLKMTVKEWAIRYNRGRPPLVFRSWIPGAQPGVFRPATIGISCQPVMAS